MQRTLVSLFKVFTLAALALTAAQSQAAEEKKADATGTWTWTQQGRGGGGGGGQERTMTLVLKADGEKLTGKLKMPGRDGDVETEIKEGKIKGDEISFTVTREFGERSITTKYAGKISGDTIKGKRSAPNREGEVRENDWEAKRQAEKK